MKIVIANSICNVAVSRFPHRQASVVAKKKKQFLVTKIVRKCLLMADPPVLYSAWKERPSTVVLLFKSLEYALNEDCIDLSTKHLKCCRCFVKLEWVIQRLFLSSFEYTIFLPESELALNLSTARINETLFSWSINCYFSPNKLEKMVNVNSLQYS